jgi:hypothetical protein
MGCEPFEGMAHIAMNNLPCGVCRGTGKTRYKRDDGELHERVCQSCYGTLYEACSPEVRGKMYTELAKYCAPQLKAIEHTGKGGEDIGIRWSVEFKKPLQIEEKK